MEKPNFLASSGHVGHFSEPDPNSIYFEGKLFSVKSAPHPGVIKFQGFFVPPLIQFLATGGGNFTVFGAWFSPLYETAMKLNYTLVGKGPNDGPQTEIWADVFSFRPDVVLIPLMPNNDGSHEALDMGLATYSKIVILLEMDHILSRKAWHHVNLMAMLTPFDFTSLVLMFIGLLFMSVLARYFTDWNRRSFQEVIWNLATALICSPQVTAKKAVWRFIGITWTLGVFLLQQLFAGEMFQAMTLPPDLNVIDTYEELAMRNSMPISVFDSREADGSRYLSPYREHREELTKRLHVLPYEFVYNITVIEGILANVSNGIENHLGAKHVLEQYGYVNDYFDGRYKDKVYISSEFGQPIPAFLFLNQFLEPKAFDAFNDIIQRMRENGVYEHWVKSYQAARLEKSVLIAGFKEAKAKHFLGLYVLCGGMLTIALLVFGFEWKIGIKTTSEAAVNAAPIKGHEMPVEMALTDQKINNKKIEEECISPGPKSSTSKDDSKNGCVARVDSIEEIERILLES